MFTSNINEKIFYAINGIHHPMLDQFMLLGSKLGAFDNVVSIFVATLLLLAISGKRKERWPWLKNEKLPEQKKIFRFFVTLLLSACLTAALVMGLKNGLHIPRPSAALPEGTVHLLSQPRSVYSFPSGHSAFAMLVVGLFWPLCRLWPAKIVLLMLALWVGISRINLGLHFPADVMAGYLCGGGAVWAAGRIPPVLLDRLFARAQAWISKKMAA